MVSERCFFVGGLESTAILGSVSYGCSQIMVSAFFCVFVTLVALDGVFDRALRFGAVGDLEDAGSPGSPGGGPGGGPGGFWLP